MHESMFGMENNQTKAGHGWFRARPWQILFVKVWKANKHLDILSAILWSHMDMRRLQATRQLLLHLLLNDWSLFWHWALDSQVWLSSYLISQTSLISINSRWMSHEATTTTIFDHILCWTIVQHSPWLMASSKNIADESLTHQYNETLPNDIEVARKVLENYSGIPPDKVIPHILEIVSVHPHCPTSIWEYLCHPHFHDSGLELPAHNH